MKVSIQAEPRVNSVLCSGVPMELEELGSQAYVRLTLDGREYDLDYREFWAAARAVCIDAYETHQ